MGAFCALVDGQLCQGVLVDYDNIPQRELQHGVVHIVDRILDAIGLSNLGADKRLDVRIRSAEPYPRARPRRPVELAARPGSPAPGATMHASISHARRSPHRPHPWWAQACRSIPLALVRRTNRPRVSRRDGRLGRRRPPALVGRKRVGEPRSFLSTTRTTRRLRRWAPEPALATPETRFELL
jgi:hypothetical protein